MVAVSGQGKGYSRGKEYLGGGVFGVCVCVMAAARRSQQLDA